MMSASFSRSPLMAVTDSGTDWRDSARRWAVTTTSPITFSSGDDGVGAEAAACCAATAVEITAPPCASAAEAVCARARPATAAEANKAARRARASV